MRPVYTLILTLTLFSCGSLKRTDQKTNTMKDKILTYQKNISNYSDTVVDASYIVTCTQVPYQIELIQQYQMGNLLDREYDSLRKLRSDYKLFYFEMEHLKRNTDFYEDDLNSTAKEKFDYLLYTLKKDIKLVTSKDTLACSGLHIEQANVIPYKKRVQLYFPTVKNDEYKIILGNSPLFFQDLLFEFFDAQPKLN